MMDKQNNFILFIQPIYFHLFLFLFSLVLLCSVLFGPVRSFIHSFYAKMSMQIKMNHLILWWDFLFLSLFSIFLSVNVFHAIQKFLTYPNANIKYWIFVFSHNGFYASPNFESLWIFGNMFSENKKSQRNAAPKKRPKWTRAHIHEAKEEKKKNKLEHVTSNVSALMCKNYWTFTKMCVDFFLPAVYRSESKSRHICYRFACMSVQLTVLMWFFAYFVPNAALKSA